MSNLLNQNRIPRIYARTTEERVREQQGSVKMPHQSWKIELDEIALREDGSFFTDHEIHRRLKRMGFTNENGEWFRCGLEAVKSAILSEKINKRVENNRINNFKMRPEQEAAVNKTVHYFKSFEREDKNLTPHFLWNAKMRFGKTFASYQLAKRMEWKKILILTFKPAVRSSWRNDLQSHIDFQGWQFVSKDEDDKSHNDINRDRPFVYFASFQDILGKDIITGIKPKKGNEWIFALNWDCVIFDEYHFGAWREKSKDLFDKNDAEVKEQFKQEIDEIKDIAKENGENYVDYFDEDLVPITTDHYLYLSGTPFRAIGTGEFIEEQIFNWTYSDEQKAKIEWKKEKGENPYLVLPKMIMLTYQLPQNIQQVALKGEFNEFDLNEFFKADGKGQNAKFKYENEVQHWLDFIRGQYLIEQDLKTNKKAPMPFSDTRLIHSLQHTFWFLPNVASCEAMGNLLAQNTYFNDYNIVVSAGTKAGVGEDALPPVEKAMGNPLLTKTITLSCGKLTTGVTVKPWTGVFMLRNTKSPETYFQTVFRVQSPWTVKNIDKTSPNREEIIKEQCYVFDFAPNRAFSQIATYSNQLNANSHENKSPEQQVKEFIQFLPILAYDGSVMTEIDAGKLLDIAMSGTTATLLARRWESALLVNVDNVTLQRLMANEQAMQALMNIEGFRSLNRDIETIVNKSEAVKKAKKEAIEKDIELTKKEKKELSDEEKKAKSIRKQIQEKLIKFATRIPVFMYLSEYREQTLKDVITQLEPDLFKKVTGLSVSDFELLEKIGVFNGALMNDAVFKFKRYEDSSLNYTGISTYDNLPQIGGFNTTITSEEFEEMK